MEEKPEEKTQLTNPMRKLYVHNLPWSLTVDDMKNVFGECGTVADVEVLSLSFSLLILNVGFLIGSVNVRL